MTYGFEKHFNTFILTRMYTKYLLGKNNPRIRSLPQIDERMDENSNRSSSEAGPQGCDIAVCRFIRFRH
jgi:hypothetical protein